MASQKNLKLRGYNLPKIMRLKKVVTAVISRVYTNCICDGEGFNCLIYDLRRLLPATVSERALRTSLSHLAGERLTAELLRQSLWRLVGNLHRLADDQPVFPWSIQAASEWVPVQIMQMRRRRGGTGKPGWTVMFQIMAGTPCPLKILKFWSDRFCFYLAKPMGFSTRWISDNSEALPHRRMTDPRELVTLRLYTLIDPAFSSILEPGFDQISVPASCVKWNREQMRFRDRLLDGYRCPFKMPDTLPCFKCSRGFGGTCRAGTHRLDYVPAFCSYCKQTAALFDRDISTEMCITCYNKRAMAKE